MIIDTDKIDQEIAELETQLATRKRLRALLFDQALDSVAPPPSFKELRPKPVQQHKTRRAHRERFRSCTFLDVARFVVATITTPHFTHLDVERRMAELFHDATKENCKAVGDTINSLGSAGYQELTGNGTVKINGRHRCRYRVSEQGLAKLHPMTQATLTPRTPSNGSGDVVSL